MSHDPSFVMITYLPPIIIIIIFLFFRNLMGAFSKIHDSEHCHQMQTSDLELILAFLIAIESSSSTARARG